MTYQLPDGVRSQNVDTSRLTIHCLTAGPNDGIPVVFLHGNIASSIFWDETLAMLPPRFRGIATDMRGFGDTDTKPIDATDGVGDFAADLEALVTTLGLKRPHLVGWSTGGLVALRYAADQPGGVASLSMVDAVPPHGFGGAVGLEGTPVNDDFSGTGAGIIPPEVLQRIQAGDRSEESDMSPRKFMNAFYWKAGYRVSPEREDAFLEDLLKSKVGEGNLPGDIAQSAYWPGFAPGTTGVNNALSGKYSNVLRVGDIEPKPPILFIHGSDDLVVSDASLYDMGNLGKLGVIPDYPGEEVYPVQQMVSQWRWFLDRYEHNGGEVTRVEIAGAGHGPHIDHPVEFRAALFGFLDRHS